MNKTTFDKLKVGYRFKFSPSHDWCYKVDDEGSYKIGENGKVKVHGSPVREEVCV